MKNQSNKVAIGFKSANLIKPNFKQDRKENLPLTFNLSGVTNL